ncbi:MAG: response regulator [Myxococcota bacterium]
MTLRAVIVDDERLARCALARLLADHHPDVQVVAEAHDVASAAVAIDALQPDVVFLDIQLPGADGFALFDRVEVLGRVVFVTAYDQFAVRAFDVNALDYLVKPVAPDRLATALDRARRSAPPEPGTAPLTADDLLCLPTPRGLALVRVRDLTHLTAADDYAEVHRAGKPPVLAAVPLRRWEERLPSGFVRVHRGVIVNVDHVDDVVRTGDTWEVHVGGAVVPMSRRYAARLTEDLGRRLRAGGARRG